jgi:5-methylcytosine-specific restriction endonuclease McrA
MKRGGPLKRKTPLCKVTKNKVKRAKLKIPTAVRKAVQERSKFQCEAVEEKPVGNVILAIRCMNPASDMHHVLPKGRGGKHEENNLKHICRSCHNFVHANPKKARDKGLFI